MAEVGAPAAVIADTARDTVAQAVVMATHGRGGLTRLLLGSVATGLLQHSDVPLVLIHPAPTRPMAVPVLPAQAAPATPAVEDTVRPVTMTAADLQLMANGLELLLNTMERDQHMTKPIQHLLSRLAEAKAPAEREAAPR
jgi:hypothetical protein